MSSSFVTIVSGIPRSGTSLMMQALEAGGLEALADHIRTADDDNPKGYYELEAVKKTKEDASWLDNAPGKVIKMIYWLLYDLPLEGYQYRVVFMQRDITETLASQKKMLDRSGKKGGDLTQDQMAAAFKRQLEKFDTWVADKNCFSVLSINYRDMVQSPQQQCEKVNEFLGGGLNIEAMASKVDPSLYRNRKE